MCDKNIEKNQLNSEQFRDLARTETDGELFRDCCNSAKKEGISLSEFMKRYVWKYYYRRKSFNNIRTGSLKLNQNTKHLIVSR